MKIVPLNDAKGPPRDFTVFNSDKLQELQTIEPPQKYAQVDTIVGTDSRDHSFFFEL
jgi:hypothetical protein